jgi:hypothetical protein
VAGNPLTIDAGIIAADITSTSGNYLGPLGTLRLSLQSGSTSTLLGNVTDDGGANLVADVFGNASLLSTDGGALVAFALPDGGVLSKVGTFGDFTGPIAPLGGFTVAGLVTPVNAAFSQSATGGSLTAATYYYRVAAASAGGTFATNAATTVASTETSIVVASGTTNTVTVAWLKVPGAIAYKVYGRSTGAELLMATLPGYALSWTDTGSVTPSGSPPNVDFSASLLINGNVTANAYTGSFSAVSIGAGLITIASTDTSGTPGNCTINKSSGRCAIAIGAATITVTSATCAAATQRVFITPMDRDATCLLPAVTTTSAGSFVVTTVGNCTAALRFGWMCVQ